MLALVSSDLSQAAKFVADAREYALHGLLCNLLPQARSAAVLLWRRALVAVSSNFQDAIIFLEQLKLFVCEAEVTAAYNRASDFSNKVSSRFSAHLLPYLKGLAQLRQLYIRVEVAASAVTLHTLVSDLCSQIKQQESRISSTLTACQPLLAVAAAAWSEISSGSFQRMLTSCWNQQLAERESSVPLQSYLVCNLCLLGENSPALHTECHLLQR